GGELSMTTVVLGDVRHAVLRSSAKPGDELWLLGEVGLSALGLRALQRGLIRSKASAVRKAIQAWRRPRALIAEGQRLVGRAHAAIDVSDGLANEAIQLARASQVQVLLHEQALTRALSASLC